MPKDILKIDKFHGGINNNSDPRDLQDSELADAIDIDVSSIGKIKMMGGMIDHTSNSPAPPGSSLYNGYGLYYFSHDRINGHIGAVNHLGNPYLADSSDWVFNGPTGWAITGNKLVYTHGSPPGFARQLYSARDVAGYNNQEYWFKTNVTSVDANIISVRLSALGPELITDSKNRDFGSSSDWSVLNIAGGSLTEPSNKLQVVTSTDAESEGAQLAYGLIDGPSGNDAFIAGGTYYVTAKLDCDATTPTIHFELGGTAVAVKATDGSPSDGTINSTEQEYYAYITTANATGALKIFNPSNGTSHTFTIDDVSVKEVGFVNEDIQIPMENGIHRVNFTSSAYAATAPFFITATSNSGDVELDNLELYPYNCSEVGDNYLCLSDLDTGGRIRLYSYNNDEWGSPIKGLTDNSAGSSVSGYRQDVFYDIEGALRVCDSNFGNTNSNRWYGYISRIWFPELSSKREFNEWYYTSSIPSPPSVSYFNNHYSSLPNIDPDGVIESAATELVTTSSVGTDFVVLAESTIDDTFTSVIKNKVMLSYNLTTTGMEEGVGQICVATFISGTSANNTDSSSESSYINFEYAKVTFLLQPFFSTLGIIIEEIYFDITETDVSPDDWDYFKTKLVSIKVAGPDGGDIINTLGWIEPSSIILRQVLFDGSQTPPNLDSASSAGLAAGKYVNGNSITALMKWANVTDANGWDTAGNTGRWKMGATFIYDEEPVNQESQMTILVDEADGYTEEIIPNNDDANTAPDIFLAIADPFKAGASAGGANGFGWNKRITGVNIYMKDVFENTGDPWYLLGSGSFLTGNFRVENTQQDYKIQYHQDIANMPYFFWTIPREGLLNPPSLITYELNSGLPEDETSIISRYKTSTVAGSKVYIANLKTFFNDGSIKVLGDAMLKCRSMKFDTFASTYISEASVRDGDEIIALENYADRILQFKRNKLHIINVSQEIEFIEGTFIHKGIKHLASVCKTDFGIAWANNYGVYFYDGNKVMDLFETQGRRIFSDSEWRSWTNSNSDSPILGYLPHGKKIVVLNNTQAGGDDNNALLFDFTTKSWTRGTDKGPSGHLGLHHSNLINGKDGELIIASSLSSGNSNIIQYWSDSPVADSGNTSSDFIIRTKDFDFETPGVRKKIYKVYITYKTGNQIPNVKVRYGVNGGTADKLFKNGTNFSSNVLSNPGNTDWAVAELKPNTSSEANNIYSFQLLFERGDLLDTGTIQSSYSTTSLVLQGNECDGSAGYIIYLTGGTGRGQYRKINSYNDGTNTATVTALDTTPDSTTTYAVGVVPAEFEINDITIVYRIKNVK